MKILIISQGLPFPIYRDGLTIRVHHLLKELSRRAECHLVSFAEYGLSTDEINELERMASYDIVNHVASRGLWSALKKTLSCRRYFSKNFENRVLKAIHTFKPDVALAEQTFMAQYVNALGGIPKVMSAVDAISLAALRQSEIEADLQNTLTWKYVAHQRLRVERKYFPRFDRITVVGEQDAQFLRAKLKRNVEVIPNGVDTHYFTPQSRNANPRSVIFSGNLSAPMNEEACLYLVREIFPILHAKHKELALVIAGRKPSEKIKRMIPPYVTIKADVPDMRDVMDQAMLYVSPIEYGTGIKNNVLQAMAMGIPVITTPLIAGPIGITRDKTGFVAERGAAFLEAIETALRNPELITRIGGNGRLHVEKSFSWQRISDRYMHMFAEISKYRASSGDG